MSEQQVEQRRNPVDAPVPAERSPTGSTAVTAPSPVDGARDANQRVEPAAQRPAGQPAATAISPDQRREQMIKQQLPRRLAGEAQRFFNSRVSPAWWADIQRGTMPRKSAGQGDTQAPTPFKWDEAPYSPTVYFGEAEQTCARVASGLTDQVYDAYFRGNQRLVDTDGDGSGPVTGVFRDWLGGPAGPFRERLLGTLAPPVVEQLKQVGATHAADAPDQHRRSVDAIRYQPERGPYGQFALPTTSPEKHEQYRGKHLSAPLIKPDGSGETFVYRGFNGASFYVSCNYMGRGRKQTHRRVEIQPGAQGAVPQSGILKGAKPGPHRQSMRRVGDLTQNREINRVAGRGLSVKGSLDNDLSARGIDPDDPDDFLVGKNMNRAHVIADRFRGSGFRDDLNVVTTSAYYNQVKMVEVENAIVEFLAASGAETFDMLVDVSWTELMPEGMQDEIKRQIKAVDDKADFGKIDAELKQYRGDLRRVSDCKYVIVAGPGTAQQAVQTFSAGMDYWLFLGAEK